MTNIVLLGDSQCGKTSWLRRLMHYDFAETYLCTIGKDTEILDYKHRKLIFHDIGGQERFHDSTKLYFHIAHGAMIFYDVTQEDARIEYWVQKVQSIPYVIVPNKRDLQTKEQSHEHAISCKQDTAVNAALDRLLRSVPVPAATVAPTFLAYIWSMLASYLPTLSDS